jgi:putative ABC transport system permease protein
MRAAARSLLRSRRFTAAVVLTLAIALGANTALFSAANTFLLRSLPYTAPDRLVAVFESQPGTRARAPVSPPDYLSWSEALRPIASLGAYRPWGFVLTGRGPAERLSGARASASLFFLLGVQPVVGRLFRSSEDVFGGPHAVLVSYRFWQQRLGATPDLSAQRIVLNGAAYSVVGVLPAEFRLSDADVWVPLALEPFALVQRGSRALSVIGRLRDGVTFAQARRALDAVAADLATTFPDSNDRWGADVVTLRDAVSGPVRPTLILLWWAVALVLLIACANVAGLMLARAGSRRRDAAIRRAIGASRARLVRSVLSESVLLSSVAGVFAVPIAVGLMALLVRAAPPDLARLADVGIDARVLAFTAALSVATGVVFGMVPALRASREDLSPLLRAAGMPESGVPRLRQAAVAGQLAVAVVVVVCAGLVGRSFLRVDELAPGFDATGVLTMALSPDVKYPNPAQRLAFFDDAIGRVRAIPGVVDAGAISHVPLAGGALIADVAGSGEEATRSQPKLLAGYSAATGGWFAAMRVPILRGRVFDDRDTAAGPAVAIVSRNLARRLWGDADPIGRQIIVGGTLGAVMAPHEVIGVAGDVRALLEAPPPYQVYVPYSQNPWPTMNIAVRTAGNASAWGPQVRTAVAALDRDQAIYNLRSFDEIFRRATATRRFQALVLWIFAAVAVLLAGVGVYGVVAYAVRLRSSEIGVRIVLGASRRSIFGLAMTESLPWCLGGLAIGAAAAGIVSRMLSSMLFGVAPSDPLTFAASTSALAALATGACAAAARRALAVDAPVLMHAE